MPSALDSADRVEVTSRAAWRAWLAANHEQPDGIWLVTFKKHTGERYVDYDSIVEEALCFGWIDSLPRKLDADPRCSTSARASRRASGRGSTRRESMHSKKRG
ncbi:MAG: hypothetical protein AAFV01_02565 [Bacteroidota bacterium]